MANIKDWIQQWSVLTADIPLWTTGLSTAFHTPRTAFDALKYVSHLNFFSPRKTVKWSNETTPAIHKDVLWYKVRRKHSPVFTSSNYPWTASWTERGQGRRSAPHTQPTYCFQHFIAEGKSTVLFPSDTLSLGKVRTCWVFCSCVIRRQINLTKAKVAGPDPA